MSNLRQNDTGKELCETKLGHELIIVEAGQRAHGELLFSLLLYMFKFSHMKTFFKEILCKYLFL